MSLRGHEPRSLGLLGFSIAGLGIVLAILWGVGLVATATGGSSNQHEPRAIVSGTPGAEVVAPGDWMNVCLVDGRHEPPVVYTYENITLANISEEEKRWFDFEGNMEWEERQVFLTRYYLNMTDEDRQSFRDRICRGSPEAEPGTPEGLEGSVGIAGESGNLAVVPQYIGFEWGRYLDGDWPEELMGCYSSGGNGLKGWRGSSPEGDGPLMAYARDNNGAPCGFTWISCVTDGWPRYGPGGTGRARMYVQARIDVDIKKSGDEPSR
ncbi:MAG: hypothetical protein ACUVXG_14125 [Anaerolineae bacterium]